MPDTAASALGLLGAADGLQGLPSGVEQLERSLAMAEELPGTEDLVGRTHALLAMAGCRGRSLDLMERYVEPGLAYCAERDIARYARGRDFPIIPCNLCGSQENMKRREIKAMLASWELEDPGRTDRLFRSLQNVAPSHLADRKLFDFESLTGADD